MSPLIEKTEPFKGRPEYLQTLNNLWNETFPNEFKAVSIRQLLEKMFKEALNYPPTETMRLSDLFRSFDYEFSTYGFKNTVVTLIRELNPWAHHSGQTLSKEDCQELFEKTNKVFEGLSGLKNKKRPWIIAPTISLLDYGSQLNEKQREAIGSNASLTLVDAGPGTGKTELVSARMISSSRTSEFSVSGKKVAGISFTNQAANELKLRIEKNQGGEWVSEDGPFITSTIHAFCLNVISKFETDQGRTFDYTVIDENEVKLLRKELGDTDFRAHLKREGQLTYDGILELMRDKLETDFDFVGFLSDLLFEVVIDEAQDLSRSQYEIFTLLKEKCGVVLYFVGDQRQNIFKFSGGSITNLKKSFPNEDIARFTLEESYRCPSNVLDFVNSMKFSDCENPGLKNPTTAKVGGRIHLTEHPSQDEEAQYIVDQIKILINFEGVGADRICVLASSSYYFHRILSYLNMSQISFDFYGGKQDLRKTIALFYDILIVCYDKKPYSLKKVMDHFRLPRLQNKTDYHKAFDYYRNEATQRSLKNVVSLLDSIRSFQLEEDQNFFELMHKMYVLFEEMNKEAHKSDSTIHELEEFILGLERHGVQDPYQMKSSVTPTNLNFKKYFKHDMNVKCEHHDPKNSIVLSTVHSAKGREWDHVFLPGLVEGVMPFYNASDTNDELKKFYVGCTRVRKELYLSYPLIYSVKGYSHTGAPSRFISGLAVNPAGQ